MRRTHRTKGAFQELKKLLHPMAQLQTGQLKRAGEMAHVLARGGEQIHPALSPLLSFGLREVTAIAHDDALFHPARERTEVTVAAWRKKYQAQGLVHSTRNT